jgi:hypothetical protein
MNKVRAAGIDNTAEWDGEYKTIYVNAGRGSVPVRVKAYKRTEGIFLEFLGVFDTVASFGVGAFASWGNSAIGYDFAVNGRPADKKKTPDQVLGGESVKEKEQWVHRTFHAIAEDEFRQVFSLEALGLDPKSRGYLRLPRTLRERPYPGAHSDVGGGYRATRARPGTPDRLVNRGRAGMVRIPGDPPVPAKSPLLCNIPLKDMHAEARAGHVPLRDLSDLPAIVGAIPPALQRLYDQYLTDRTAIFNRHIGNWPRLADYVPSVRTDPVYLQAIPQGVFQAIQRERLASAAYQALERTYIHDSNAGAASTATNILTRVINPFRTFTTQRGVNHRGRQNSYDPESRNVR